MVNSRREFIVRPLSGLSAAAPAPRTFAAQLYTVRSLLRREPDGR